MFVDVVVVDVTGGFARTQKDIRTNTGED